MKICSKCGVEKSAEAFKVRSDNPATLRSQCRECDARYLTEWRKSRESQVRAYEAAYRVSHAEERRETFRVWYERNRASQIERSRQYAANNPEKMRELSRRGAARERKEKPKRVAARMARYRKSHRDLLRAAGRAYHAANRERVMERKRKHAKTDDGKLVRQAIRQRRLARQRGAVGSFTIEGFRLKCEYYGWCCYLCYCDVTPRTVVIEHRIPLARGGSNWLANLAPSCAACNLAKNTKTDREYLVVMSWGERAVTAKPTFSKAKYSHKAA